MKIPKKELERLGFTQFETEGDLDICYERADGTILEDVNADESVDLSVLLEACCSMSALNAEIDFKTKLRKILS